MVRRWQGSVNGEGDGPRLTPPPGDLHEPLPPMSERDPDHWLYRLTADEWLRAARAELEAARRALEGRQHKAGVTQARRAAGMAWNAVLVVTRDETGYGRSYMDHVAALTTDAGAPEPVQRAAQALLAAPLVAQVVQIGRGDAGLAAAAEVIVAFAPARAAPAAGG